MYIYVHRTVIWMVDIYVCWLVAVHLDCSIGFQKVQGSRMFTLISVWFLDSALVILGFSDSALYLVDDLCISYLERCILHW